MTEEPARPVLGLLHTSPLHVATFDALADQAAQEPRPVTLRHLVREDLLARARVDGPEALTTEVALALADLDADAVLCTCSTIGAVAERVGAGSVLRVDRPMAAATVATARNGDILVLAALETTLGPTLDLLAEEADRAGAAPRVRAQVVEGAWDRFEAGDPEGYHALIGDAVEAAEGACDVVVLAQASMATAADRTRLVVPVLSSPTLGLREALRRVRG